MTALHRRLLINTMKLFDLAVISLSFALFFISAFQEEAGVSLGDYMSMRVKVQNVFFFLLFLLCGHLTFAGFGLYESRRLRTGASDAVDILKISVLGTLCLVLAGWVFDYSAVMPVSAAVFFVSLSTITISSRIFLRWGLSRLRLHGRNLRYVLLVGTNTRTIKYAKEIERRLELGYRIVGFVDNEWAGSEEFRQSGYRTVTDLAGFADFIRCNAVDEVVIDLPVNSHYQEASRILSLCEEQGILVRYISNIFSLTRAHPVAESAWEAPVLILTGPRDGWMLLVKRLLDIAIGLVLLVLLAPLFILAGILIKATSRGPVFFAQERVGLNKRTFTLYKFRTMSTNAEQMQAELESLNEVSGPVFKIKNDPRVTLVGAILRKTSIDELPQLYNVLKGDMSLVGPRPLPVRDYRAFDQDWHRRRFSVRPGMTCLWQINGRSSISFDRWMELDMEYIDTWSLSLDFKILLRTVPAVLAGIGAH